MAQVQGTLERSRLVRRHSPMLDRGHPMAGQPRRPRPDATALLRDLAFVYHATRTVREAMTAAPAAR
jgi:hypothetical protein